MQHILSPFLSDPRPEQQKAHKRAGQRCQHLFHNRVPPFAGLLGKGLHILFDLNEDDIKNEIEKVRSRFIGLIPITRLDRHKTIMLSRENLAREGGTLKTGFSDLIPPTDKVLELVDSPEWRDKTFLFLGYKEWSNLEKNNQLKPLKEDLYGRVGAFFSSNYQTINDSQKWLNEFGKKKLIHSLDIHDFNVLDTAEINDEGEYLDSKKYCCYTWIKADRLVNKN